MMDKEYMEIALAMEKNIWSYQFGDFCTTDDEMVQKMSSSMHEWMIKHITKEPEDFSDDPEEGYYYFIRMYIKIIKRWISKIYLVDKEDVQKWMSYNDINIANNAIEDVKKDDDILIQYEVIGCCQNGEGLKILEQPWLLHGEVVKEGILVPNK